MHKYALSKYRTMQIAEKMTHVRTAKKTQGGLNSQAQYLATPAGLENDENIPTDEGRAPRYAGCCAKAGIWPEGERSSVGPQCGQQWGVSAQACTAGCRSQARWSAVAAQA